jgi:hypothetical protein
VHMDQEMSRDETREVQCMGECSYKVSIAFMVVPTSAHISDNVRYESGGSGDPPASLAPYTSACTILFKSAQCAHRRCSSVISSRQIRHS